MKKEDYPITMTAKHVAEILGISLRMTYEEMKNPDFPAIKIGRHIKVHRDKFFEWMDRKADKEIS
jgi:excisionase family DNA binding protein